MFTLGNLPLKTQEVEQMSSEQGRCRVGSDRPPAALTLTGDRSLRSAPLSRESAGSLLKAQARVRGAGLRGQAHRGGANAIVGVRSHAAAVMALDGADGIFSCTWDALLGVFHWN